MIGLRTGSYPSNCVIITQTLMKMTKKRALEEFLNDEVQEVEKRLFKWRSRYYEVLPRSLVVRRHLSSHFVTLNDQYMMREATDHVIKKYYPLTYKTL